MSTLSRPMRSIAAISLVTLVLAACAPTKREYPATDAGNSSSGGTNSGVGGDAGTSSSGGINNASNGDAGTGGTGAFVCKPACSGATPFCDESKKECVECLTNDSCTDPAAPACVAGDCSACATDSQCLHISGRTVCKTTLGSDAGVAVTDAGAEPGTCVECVEHLDCSSARPICNQATNTCIQCIANTDCLSASAPVCSKNSCVACTSNADCNNIVGKNVCLLGVCVRPTVAELSLGAFHSCARLTDGTVKCWGFNRLGQLGNGDTMNRSVPVPVTGISQATQIAAGYYQSCAVLAGGTAQCWGDNSHGELGNTDYATGSSVPVPVSNLSAVRKIAAGGEQARGTPAAIHTCALLDTGAVKCWGSNQFGELGNGTTTDSTTPVDVTAISQATDVGSGSASSCARLSNNSVVCWGKNGNGELGNANTTDNQTPSLVSFVANAQSIAVGLSHACSLSTVGAVQCWGSNHFGQINDGTTIDAITPVLVANLSGVTAIAAGGDHTCALLTGGSIQCWGDNSVGQLGNGTTVGGLRVPVTGLAQPAVAISAGGYHTCALLNDTSVACWGSNSSGALGVGNTVDSLVPVPVVDL